MSNEERKLVRVLLDTNVWSYLHDDGSVQEFDQFIRESGVTVVLAPSVLVEVLRTPNQRVRDGVIRAMNLGPRRVRLPPEAYTETLELVEAVGQYRPAWMHQISNPAVVAKHLNFWTKGIWREVTVSSDRLHSYGLRSTDRDLLVSSQRDTRQRMVESDFKFGSLQEMVVSADESAPAERLLGWDGQAVPAWRISTRDLYWHQLVEVGSRAALTREDTTYLDWVGARVDVRRLRQAPGDYTSFWLNDVRQAEMPRNWMRWAVNLVQVDGKVTGGNPVDEQHSTYLLDTDVFITADRGYVRVLNRVGQDALFLMPAVRLISGDGAAGSTAARVIRAMEDVRR